MGRRRPPGPLIPERARRLFCGLSDLAIEQRVCRRVVRVAVVRHDGLQAAQGPVASGRQIRVAELAPGKKRERLGLFLGAEENRDLVWIQVRRVAETLGGFVEPAGMTIPRPENRSAG